jgi:hypothetical protein
VGQGGRGGNAGNGSTPEGGALAEGGADTGGNAGGGSAGMGAEAGAGAGGGGGAGCGADERRCRDDVPEACGADGQWEATSTGCAFGCADGACKSCEEGTKACENGQAKTCVNGAWQFAVCESQCEAGECVDTCTEGASQCDGLSKTQVCKGGTFVPDKDCAGICSEGKCVGVCKPDATRCRPGSTTISELCSSQGEWVAAPCSGLNSVCLAGSCVACTPGEKRCTPKGIPLICSEFGSWVEQAPCAGAAPACVEGECRLCEPGSRRCSAGKPQQCNVKGTAWVDGPACSGATPACVAETGLCGTCKAGDRQCGSETTPQACDASGHWVDQAKCATTAPVCLDGTCAACLPNSRRCVGATPQLCSSEGQWVNQATCSGSTPSCVATTGSCGCTTGSAECLDSNTPQVCSESGTWVPQADCRGDTPICSAGGCVCNEGEQECTSATTPRVCEKGVWVPSTCTGATPVCVAGKCQECTPDATRCTPDGSHIVQVCSTDGVWKESMQCADFCSHARCLTPGTGAGVLGCDGETGLMCKDQVCCFAGKGTGYCEEPRVACSAKTIPMECDGPSDCAKATPICCAAATGIGCVALAADCTKLEGVIVCDPSDPVCPLRTTCRRASTSFFTCQGLL